MILHREGVLSALRAFVGREILDGQDIGLDDTTPLLEWGIINSFEIARVVAFIAQEFRVTIPPQQIVVGHFDTLAHLTDLVISLAQPAAPAPGVSAPASGAET
jgi:acyl carrier protein